MKKFAFCIVMLCMAMLSCTTNEKKNVVDTFTDSVTVTDSSTTVNESANVDSATVDSVDEAPDTIITE